jgi:Cu+-exporting ATPase
MIAAAAMALSSISVVSNASRLRGFEPIEFEDVLEAELESGAPSVEVSQGQDDHEHHVEDSTVTDPVCGMTIDPATAAASVEHEGQMYYFCSDGYRDSFVVAPADYISS